MKILAAFAALLVAAVTAPAAILIFDGPAPVRVYGIDDAPQHNHAVLIFDNGSGQVGIINYFKSHHDKQQAPVTSIETDASTIPIKKGSLTVGTGVLRIAPAQDDFRTFAISFRGRNSLLNRESQIIGPRLLSGIFRATTRSGTVTTHFEQSFSVRYDQKLSNAANTASEDFGAAVDRVRSVLQNRGYAAQVE